MHELINTLKVFLTGATGFIGSHIADKLIENGYEVTVLIREKSNTRWLEGKPLKYIKNEIINDEFFSGYKDKFDYIFHIGGATYGRNYNDFYKSNTLSTENLIKSAVKYLPNLKRFVMLSSLTVNGPSKNLSKPVNEDSGYNPLTNYAKSKAEAEKVLIKYHGDIPYTIIRSPAVYGERDTAIYGVFQAASYGLGILIGFNDKHLSLIHGIDLARGTIEAAFHPAACNDIFFISNNEFYSWKQLINLMSKYFGKKLLKIKVPHFIVLIAGVLTQGITYFRHKPPVFNYEKAVDFIQSNWICSTEKSENILGYRSEIPIETGIKNTIEWYKSMKWI